MFSIVVPVYNKEAVLKTTLDSVLQQTEQNFEVILVNDGSNDGSIDIIKPYLSDVRFKVVDQSNRGVSAARNRGIKEAKYQWVAFLDADDWWHRNYLQSVKALINSDSKTLFVASSFLSKPDCNDWKPENWAVNDVFQIQIISNLPRRWMKGIPFFTSSVCLNKLLLNNQSTLFKEGKSNGEDLDLWFRLSEQGPITLLQSGLVVYRANQEGSLTSYHEKIEEPYHITNIKKRLKLGSIPRSFKSSYRFFIGQHYLSQSRDYLVNGKRVTAFKFCLYGFYAITSKRWWMTLLMCLFLSKSFVNRWIVKKSGRQEFKVEK